ncbi:hypothetical protein QFZ82_003564 [Streptomyces sp. V4I23]|uniref:MmpS family transport accessory protein n=1 Tax=Streptomyces sp. V4I23 TaxID=3042282 RepID=UPI00277E5905|nr:MmpS family transport accessory protein [Streptomyces sp. V4I23]MDQ1009079.1 hypothetical protein [Streptomyces sp. V4I23]
MPTAGRRSRTPRLLWLLGAMTLVIGAGTLIGATGGTDASPSREDRMRKALRPTPHTVVYEVTGAGRTSPDISFRTDGVNTTERVEDARLPWRRKVTLTAGPAAAVAQVMAAGGDSDSVSCSVRVDGLVVDSKTSTGRYTNVSCSFVVPPGEPEEPGEK